VAQTFFTVEDVESFARLDGIITLVDAKHIEQHLDAEKPEGAENESVEQVAFADRMLLNKTDLVTEEDLVRIEARLKSINKFAPIVRCCKSEVNVENVLNIKGFDLKRTLEMDPGFLATDSEHVHDQNVTSLSIVQPHDVNYSLVSEWLGILLRTKGADIYRMKGILAISRTDEKFVYQGVHMIFNGSFEDVWGNNETRESKLVFIGKHLDHAELKAGFAACLDSPENAEKIRAMEETEAVQQRGNMLFEAARIGDTEGLELLISEGADIALANQAGQTALHIACLWGMSSSVQALVYAGANVDVKNAIRGETPLHMLAVSCLAEKGTMEGRLEAARILTEAGADLRVTNEQGLTPHQIILEGEGEGAGALLRMLAPDTTTKYAALRTTE
jgi:hypothetical protein